MIKYRKWHKLRWLLTEYIMVWRKQLNLFSPPHAHPNSKLNTNLNTLRANSSNKFTLDPMSNGAVRVLLECCQKTDATITLELFQKTKRYAQDIYNDDTSSVRTQIDLQVISLEYGVFYTNGSTHVSVFEQHGQLVPQLSHFKFAPGRKSTLSINISREVTGTTACLYGSIEDTTGNYGHWLIDALSRLKLINQVHSLDTIDHFLVPTLHFDYQRDSLAMLGVNLEKVLEVKPLDCIQFEQLICCTAPRGYSSLICPHWVIEYYRKTFTDSFQTPERRRRLYISRNDAKRRKFKNERILTELLKQHGFDIIELSQYPLIDKIKLFQSAECIVGLTGAGLSNLMFCQPGTRVIELFPPRYVHYYYNSICGSLGLGYHYLILEANRKPALPEIAKQILAISNNETHP